MQRIFYRRYNDPCNTPIWFNFKATKFGYFSYKQCMIELQNRVGDTFDIVISSSIVTNNLTLDQYP